MDRIVEMLSLMGLVGWLSMGLGAGLASRFLLPGKDPSGCVSTVAIGISGALIGGLLATWLDFGGLSRFDLRGLTIATLGAFVALLLLRVLRTGGEDE